MRQALDLLSRVGEVGRELVLRARPSRQDPQSRHPLLQDQDALDPRHRRELACALAVLWEDFGADLGGDTGYLSHTPAERAEYVTFLQLGAHRVRQNGGQEKLHFALAAELMALYVEAIEAAAPSQRNRESAAAIAEIAAQGTLIRRAGAGLRPKRCHLNA